MGFFAQTSDLYTNDYNNLTADESTFMGFAFGTLLLGLLIFWVLSIIALWKVFEKAGEKGWKAIIPLYNYWVLCQIAGRPGWWALSALLAVIPYVGWIVALVVYIVVALDVGKAFGKTTLFSVLGLVIFSYIGLMILGFGDAKYKKPVHAKTPVASA